MGELRKDYLANRAVPHMSQISICTPKHKLAGQRDVGDKEMQTES